MQAPTSSVVDWPGSLWAEARVAEAIHPPLNGDHRADVTVIGAGFTGLRTAIELAEAGTSVVVLDAGDVGWGASGRNGGQVNPMLPFNSPKQLRELVGPVYFERLTAASLSSADDLFAFIARHGIACQARQRGWLRVLHSPAARRKAEADLSEWNEHGAGMSLIDGEDVTRLSGTRAYSSGVVAPRGGAVHPLMLAQGMATVARNLGVMIHGSSRAERLERKDGNWQVSTGAGRVSSDWVVVATNGYTDDLVGGLRRSIIPINPIQIATEPLPEKIISEILPEGHTISDSRRVIMYARREPDNRIVYGGLGKLDRNGVQSGFDWLQRDAVRVFPQLAGVSWSHRWGGQIALTEDHLPHLHEPRTGLLAGLGYNGRGVAMTNVMGKIMAQRVLGAAPDTLAFPMTKLRPFGLRALKQFGMGPAVGVMRTLDWLETR